MWLWHLGAWFSAGLGSAGLRVSLDGLRGLSNVNNSALILRGPTPSHVILSTGRSWDQANT